MHEQGHIAKDLSLGPDNTLTVQGIASQQSVYGFHGRGTTCRGRIHSSKSALHPATFFNSVPPCSPVVN